MLFGTRHKPLGRTSLRRGNKAYGAKANKLGPIGGGKGYTKIVRSGNYCVGTVDELIAAVRRARKGETIFVESRAEIDLTTRIHIDKVVLKLRGGVTLASDRGYKGSKGGLICSDEFATRPLIKITGPNVRVTGLRIQGPQSKRCLYHHDRCFDSTRGHDYYYKFPISTGIETTHPRLTVDNCEMAGWSLAAINARAGKEHHIHHNFIHHNQYNGLGYGVCHCKAQSLIEYNLFDWNRHSIAGTGEPGCNYEARHNVELGESLSHCFDVHGGSDRQDGTDIAGDGVLIHHNTFRSKKRPIAIRGVPISEAKIHHNWFLHHEPARGRDAPSGWHAKGPVMTQGNTRVHDNAYGITGPRIVLE